MNSYELDQPLDLRLKALNLSRTLHYEPSKYPDQHQPIHHHNPNLLANNIMMAAHCQSNNYLSLPPILSNNNNNFSNITSHQQHILNPPPYMLNHQNVNQHQVNMFQSQSITSPASNNIHRAHDSQPDLSPQASQYNQHIKQNQEPSHQMRSTNIHCQPLNHHQPHPLSSRLAPPRSTAPTPQQVVASPAMSLTVQRQSSLPPTTTTAPSTPNSSGGFDSPGLQSAQNYAYLQAATQMAGQRQSTSPRHQVAFAHHHQQAMPVRSLSMSAHMLSSSHMTHMVPPTLTPPSTNTLSAGQHHPSQPLCSQSGSMSSKCARGYKTSGNDIPHQQLIKLSAAVSQASGSLSTSYDSSISSSSNSNSSSSSLSVGSTITNNNINNNNNTPTIIGCSTSQSSSSSSANNNNNSSTSEIDNKNNDSSSASPITRQHSLVSRYNCKPCGIVFSQPETLRAHQEGYCTKRDRGQPVQIRSQSAVSPTALQQTASNASSASSNNRNASNK